MERSFFKESSRNRRSRGPGGVQGPSFLGFFSGRATWFVFCLFFPSHIKKNINLLKKSVPPMGAAVNNVLMSVGAAGEQGSSFPSLPYPAGGKDMNAAGWLPNGPWKSLR